MSHAISTAQPLVSELSFDDRMRQAGLVGKLSRTATMIAYPVMGMMVLFLAWWLGGRWLANHPDFSSFADFAPEPTFHALHRMYTVGAIAEATMPSLWRIVRGLGWAAVLGIPIGILIGCAPIARNITNMPMQFLRMVSPLAWMPIAIMVFDSWEGAIVFLIFAASIWPVIFSTSHGLSKLDPHWFMVARNLGARPHQMLWFIVLPAIAQDIFSGIRLALGVAWVVLVPAEMLGVTSGLGYSINDARDCLEYDRLSATVVIIGVIGFLADSVLRFAIDRAHWLEN